MDLWALSSIWIACSRAGSPTIPYCPCSFNLNIWYNYFREKITIKTWPVYGIWGIADYFPMSWYFSDSMYLQSQGPVSVEVPVHGLLPLKSIWRGRISALQVPEHAPQLSQVVQAPSSETWDNKNNSIIYRLNLLTFTESCVSRSACAWPVTTKKHLTLSHICIAGSRTCTPAIPSSPGPFIWNMG